LDNKINLSLNGGTDLTLINKRVSDKDYFKEIALEGTSRERLLSYAKLNSSSELLNISFYSENEQIVNSGTYGYTKKYELNLNKEYELENNLQLVLTNTNTKFDNKSSTKNSVTRNHFDTKVSKKYQDLSYEFAPSLSMLHTIYSSSLRNTNRSIYNLNLNSKLFLERELEIFDKPLIQTLTPTISYSYTPKKTQNLINNYDTESLASNSLESLFSINDFIGSDKISNQNDLTLGFESEFIDDNSGETFVSLKTAQKFYFDDEKLDSSGNFSRNTLTERGYSNIETSLEFGNYFSSLTNSFSYDPQKNKVDSSRTALRYYLDSDNFIDLSYIDDNSIENARLYGVLNINESNTFFWNINRNLSSSITDRLSFGFSREDCCLAYRFAFFKKHISSNNYSYDRAFEIVFKGLSSTTPSLRRRIEAEIPNYIGDLDNNL